MTDMNFDNLKAGDEIKVVTAWGANETLEEISSHFFSTKIEEIWFQPFNGEFLRLRITAKDADGIIRRVNWVVQDGEIRSAAVITTVSILREKAAMVCLNDRMNEVAAAMTRGLDSALEVFNDWERDTFHVKNKTKGTEYEVNLKTINGKAYGSCKCPDFQKRKRVCKHLAKVLSEIAFSSLARS